MKTRDLIFRILTNQYEPMTQAQLRLATERSRASISRDLAAMVKEGSVIRKDFPTTQDGKRPSEYRLRAALKDDSQDLVLTGTRVELSDADAEVRFKNGRLQRQIDHLVAAIKISLFDMSVGDFTEDQLRDALNTYKDVK